MIDRTPDPEKFNQTPSMAHLILVGTRLGTMIESLRRSIDDLSAGNNDAARAELGKLDMQVSGFQDEIESWVYGSQDAAHGG